MKPNYQALSTEKKDNSSSIVIIGVVILLLQLTFHLSVGAKSTVAVQQAQSDTIKTELTSQLHNPATLKKFNFPNTVLRFYALNAENANWLRPEENIAPTVLAMLLLDCVKQYGLQPQNYHPAVLQYKVMHRVLNVNQQATAAEKVQFELMLTDAMISIINNLHYGAHNPDFDNQAIGSGMLNGLKAEDCLLNACNSKNFMDAVLEVQPKIEQYQQLQRYMKLIAGQYICDSYETPEAEIRKIAMNMERLRWINNEQHSYVLINIPSFELFYQSRDSTFNFKVVVGKGATPTPRLQSSIYLIETAPDWNVPTKIFLKEILPKAIKNPAFLENNHMVVYDASENIINTNPTTLKQIEANPKGYHLRQSAGCDNALGKVVFRFANSYGVYLHDTPEQLFFKREMRALSHGCIRVENAGKLAAMILTQDKQQKKVATLNAAMNGYAKKQLKLINPVPIIISYLTYTVRDGMLVIHKDTYGLDDQLERKIYGSPDPLTKN